MEHDGTFLAWGTYMPRQEEAHEHDVRVELRVVVWVSVGPVVNGSQR